MQLTKLFLKEPVAHAEARACAECALERAESARRGDRVVRAESALAITTEEKPSQHPPPSVSAVELLDAEAEPKIIV